ncbi:MAG TPA: phosphotransferase [Steroidobacteraceae bacterium]|jgi:thiamine kinase-like enzyme|nr:phosphotransferase [Steroidobacteraceae bacterium]
MQPPDVERLCRTIVPGSGSVQVQFLGAGLLSETYKVTRDGAAYALKVASEHRPELGLDRAWEVRILERAGGAGLAPRLAYSDAGGTVVVARWVSGLPWVLQESTLTASIRSIAALLRRVHALAVPAPPRVVSPLQWITIYGTALSRRSAPPDDPALRTAAINRAQEIAEPPLVAGVVCHSDLHAMNLIRGAESLILLDWEYAHVADPLWDLAGWSANNDLEAGAQWTLLNDYMQATPAQQDWRRLRLFLWLYDYVCLLWCQLYSSVLGEQGWGGEGAGKGIAERARVLDARLHLPAHYAA